MYLIQEVIPFSLCRPSLKVGDENVEIGEST